jgi:hypothetical protein
MSETQYPIITVCGSMRYFDKMMVAANAYTQAGWIVLMPFVSYIKPGEQENNPVKEMLDDMHFSKIAMSEAILVVGKHRGVSTTNEINYAKDHGVNVREWHGFGD